MYHSYTARVLRRIRRQEHPWALSNAEQNTEAATNLLEPLDNGQGALFHYLIANGLPADEVLEVARILEGIETLESRYRAARPQGKHNVRREASRYVYVLWRLKFPTITEVSLYFAEGREEDVTGFRSSIVSTWNTLRSVGQAELIGRINRYQQLVIHKLGPLCHMLLSPHASDVLDTSEEDPTLVARWTEYHLNKGLPAYDHRRKNRNYITSYDMWEQVFETVPFNELRTEEAGHHWLPTPEEIHDVWQDRLDDPTAPLYRSPAPERFPIMDHEKPQKEVPYEFVCVRSVNREQRAAAATGTPRRRDADNNSEGLKKLSLSGERGRPSRDIPHGLKSPIGRRRHAASSRAATSPAASPRVTSSHAASSHAASSRDASSHAVSSSRTGSSRTTQGLSDQVATPPVAVKKLRLPTPGPATPEATVINKEEEDMAIKMENIEEWRDNVNNELNLVAPSYSSASSESPRGYGDERIDYRLYNEMLFTDPDNAHINHDIEEDSYEPFGYWDSRHDERDTDGRLVPSSDVSDALAVALANGESSKILKR